MKPGLSRVLNVVLSHQDAMAMGKTVAWWTDHATAAVGEDLLLAATGSEADYAAAAHPQKLFLRDPRLQTRDHQRERQNYAGLFAAVTDWLRAHDPGPISKFSHLHLAEYDHLPLVPDLATRQLAVLHTEDADVLGFGVQRIDGTSHPHSLYHAHDPAFGHFLAGITRRPDDPGVTLTMLGTGSFWTRAAWEAVAAVVEPFPIYLELWMPTVAHHLGFRVRPYSELRSELFVRHLGDLYAEIPRARAVGAWSIHPVKRLPGTTVVATTARL